MQNFDFLNKSALWLLLIALLLLVWFAFIRYQRKKYLKKLGKSEIVNKLQLENSNFRPWLKFLILLTALVLLIIGMANPQFATETKVSSAENGEIIIALDISNSMLSTDNNFRLSRLDLAKNAISKFIDVLKTEKVGLISFAGQAVMQIPITRDYSTFYLMLNSIDPSYISSQGTAIADAIDLACESFSPDKQVSKTIILISDGEDHEGNIDKAIENAKSEGVKIFTVGIGSSAGAPVIINGKPLKDKNGNIVISKLNESILRKIAKQTKGEYLNLSSNINSLKNIYNKLKKTDKQGKVKVAKYEAKFHYFVFPALLLIILEFFILTRENRWLAKINIFEKRKF